MSERALKAQERIYRIAVWPLGVIYRLGVFVVFYPLYLPVAWVLSGANTGGTMARWRRKQRLAALPLRNRLAIRGLEVLSTPLFILSGNEKWLHDPENWDVE